MDVKRIIDIMRHKAWLCECPGKTASTVILGGTKRRRQRVTEESPKTSAVPQWQEGEHSDRNVVIAEITASEVG